MSNNTTNITNNTDICKICDDYDFLSAKNFFGGSDSIRLAILLFILLSFIFNAIIFFIIIYYKRKRDFSMSGILTSNILIVNFIHTFSYILNWVIKNKDTEVYLENKNEYINVGALLSGNPFHFTTCRIQSFLLIFSSISQDIIVIILFSYINSGEKEQKHLYNIILIIAGFLLPFSITGCYACFDVLGIDKKFCYVSKYTFDLDNDYHTIEYRKNSSYNICKGMITLIRGISFCITLFLLMRALRYIKRSNKNSKKRLNLISSLPVVLITFFTLCVELIYRIISFISNKYEEKLIATYVILNSVDSILLPLAFTIEHKLYAYFCCYSTKNNYYNYNNDNDSSIKDYDVDKLLPDMKEKELKDK